MRTALLAHCFLVAALGLAVAAACTAAAQPTAAHPAAAQAAAPVAPATHPTFMVRVVGQGRAVLLIP